MILDKIVEKKKIYLEGIKNQLPLTNLIKSVDEKTRKPLDFYSALKDYDDISIIAEVKKASPSKGLICPNFDPLKIAQEYLKSDVQAISVLTETDFFLGNPQFLYDISKISDVPLLRKDFIIEEYQIYEAYLLGADAILLIMAILDDETVKKFYKLAKKLGLSCLVEIHNSEEVKRAMEIGADIIGINNRNLYNFSEDIHTTEHLRAILPNDIVVISESSIKNYDDIKFLMSLNVDGVLIGESFMRADNINKAVMRMRGKVL